MKANARLSVVNGWKKMSPAHRLQLRDVRTSNVTTKPVPDQAKRDPRSRLTSTRPCQRTPAATTPIKPARPRYRYAGFARLIRLYRPPQAPAEAKWSKPSGDREEQQEAHEATVPREGFKERTVGLIPAPNADSLPTRKMQLRPRREARTHDSRSAERSSARRVAKSPHGPGRHSPAKRATKPRGVGRSSSSSSAPAGHRQCGRWRRPRQEPPSPSGMRAYPRQLRSTGARRKGAEVSASRSSAATFRHATFEEGVEHESFSDGERAAWAISAGRRGGAERRRQPKQSWA